MLDQNRADNELSAKVCRVRTAFRGCARPAEEERCIGFKVAYVQELVKSFGSARLADMGNCGRVPIILYPM